MYVFLITDEEQHCMKRKKEKFAQKYSNEKCKFTGSGNISLYP